jgi:hypothetical protein
MLIKQTRAKVRAWCTLHTRTRIYILCLEAIHTELVRLWSVCDELGTKWLIRILLKQMRVWADVRARTSACVDRHR